MNITIQDLTINKDDLNLFIDNMKYSMNIIGATGLEFINLVITNEALTFEDRTMNLFNE